jgi:hypothetical protein
VRFGLFTNSSGGYGALKCGGAVASRTAWMLIEGVAFGIAFLSKVTVKARRYGLLILQVDAGKLHLACICISPMKSGP